jgi:aspartate-semialdehyde dehydrogenase
VGLQGRVVVVGAKGVVGGELLGVLAEREVPAERVSAYGSERSAGAEAEYGEESLEVERMEADAFRNAEVAFLAVPAEAARPLAARAQDAGAWVIDASAAFRSDASVPLAVPGRRVASPQRGRVICCASPVTAALLAVLEPLGERGVLSATVTAMLGAGAWGAGGVAELERETVDLMSGREPEPRVFPHRLAFNVVPQVGAMGEAGVSSEEAAWAAELARLWPAPPPAIAGTAVQVPGFFGHFLSVEVRLRSPATADEVRALWQAASGLKVLDQPQDRVYPMPMLVSAEAAVHAGRVRVAPGRPDCVLFTAAFEGARRTAVAAVDAAESLTGPVH